jgi:hypothetical protein
MSFDLFGTTLMEHPSNHEVEGLVGLSFKPSSPGSLARKWNLLDHVFPYKLCGRIYISCVITSSAKRRSVNRTNASIRLNSNSLNTGN